MVRKALMIATVIIFVFLSFTVFYLRLQPAPFRPRPAIYTENVYNTTFTATSNTK